MKKILILLMLCLATTNIGYCAENNSVAMLGKIGFSNEISSQKISPECQIKETFTKHLKYSNDMNYEGLKALYAPTYINADGFNRDVYFDLVKKTWASYPKIKYIM